MFRCKYAFTKLLWRQLEPETGHAVRELSANLFLLLAPSPRELRLLFVLLAVLAREDLHGEVAKVHLLFSPRTVGEMVEQGVGVVSLGGIIFNEVGK